MCVRSRSERRFILEHIELLMKKSILSGEKFQISARNTEKLPLLGLNNLTTTLFFRDPPVSANKSAFWFRVSHDQA